MKSIKFLLITSLLFPINTFAQTKLDNELLRLGVVNENYLIVDLKTYDEAMRLTTNQITPMLPLRVDSVTTVLGININRFGYYSFYQIDDVETPEQANELMDFGLRIFYKNYICSLDLGKSLVFKRNNMNINFTIINSLNQVIHNYRFPFKEC